MKKLIVLILVALLIGACKTNKDLRPPLMNTNAFSSFIPLEAYTRTNRLENLDDKIEEIIRSDTNKPTIF